MHIRLSDRHAGKAAEAPVVPTGAFLQQHLVRGVTISF